MSTIAWGGENSRHSTLSRCCSWHCSLRGLKMCHNAYNWYAICYNQTTTISTTELATTIAMSVDAILQASYGPSSRLGLGLRLGHGQTRPCFFFSPRRRAFFPSYLAWYCAFFPSHLIRPPQPQRRPPIRVRVMVGHELGLSHIGLIMRSHAG